MIFLDEEFLKKYSTQKPPFGPIGELVYLRTYALDDEVWQDTVARVVNGCYTFQRNHMLKTGGSWSDKKACESAEKMYDHMFNMRFLPPGRGLRNCGTRLKAGGASLNNCGFVSTDNLQEDLAAPFKWAMDMLMLGVGVGFDLKGSGVTLTPPGVTTRVMIIPDTREGWVDALGTLLNTYVNGGPKVYFDYSEIRPEGAPISSGGVASGPAPLKEMLDDIRDLLRACWRTLSGENINDIFALIGRCVVAGGVRRSAQIALVDSFEDYSLKDPSKYPYETSHYRWAANHSVVVEKGASIQDYQDILFATRNVDELGIAWIDNMKSFSRMKDPADNKDYKAKGSNPCAEQTLEDKELCCLVEVFPTRIENEYEMQSVLKYAYLYAKSVTLVPVLNSEDTNAIVARNRRIGCSLTGIQQKIAEVGCGEFYSQLDRSYHYLKQLDRRYSCWMGVPESIKITSVKPSGTVSKLPGVSSGMHFPLSTSYFQVIRLNKFSPYLDLYRKANYRVVDLSPGEPNTFAVYFGVLDSSNVRSQGDVSPWEQMEHAAKLQHYWADNQVSVTISYKKEDRGQIPYMLDAYQDRLKSVSFFPESHSFAHAPWTAATEEEVKGYIAGLGPVDLNGVRVSHEADDEFCDGGTCEVPKK